MKPNGTLLSGHIGKADLVKEMLNESCVTHAETLNLCLGDKICVVIDTMHVVNKICVVIDAMHIVNKICVVIDVMHVVNKINQKPAWIKTGDNLTKEFTNHIDIRSQNASTVMIVFDNKRHYWKTKYEKGAMLFQN